MSKEKKNSAFMKPVTISRELADFLGKPGPLARTEVTKLVWDYIKKEKLQDKKDGRVINPDEKLGRLLGSKASLSMFEMTKKVAQHLKDPALVGSK